MTKDADIDTFVQWFQSNEGYVDTKVMGITEFPASGRGAIALCDIPEGYTLFTLPRTITLSTRTSPLPSLFGLNAWRTHGLHKGWVGLILCMMWEDAWAHEFDTVDGSEQSRANVQMKWAPYMCILPTTFDTPMFWNAEELEELQGTAVVEKIGREDAERTYSEQLVPAIKTSPTLFPPSHHEKWYTLDAYHRAGSRILSRSFTVSRWMDDDKVVEDSNSEAGEGGSDADEAKDPPWNASAESSMDIDDTHSHPSFLEDSGNVLNSDSEDDDEDPSDVAMVPMADILNAKWGSENAKLFYEPLTLRMVTTKNIKQGEQIFNTYGDPPNSELLRRYGHVDLVRLPSSSPSQTLDKHGDVEMCDGSTDVENVVHLGNPSDIVEIRADLVVDVVRTTDFASRAKDMGARIEWWLDEGEDDTFVLNIPEHGSHPTTILLPALISLIRLLILSEPDFKSAHSKGKLPKGNLKKTDFKESKEVLEILDVVFEQREAMYVGGSAEDDERLLSAPETLAKRKRYAVIVRLGEKRILWHARHALRAMLAELPTTSMDGPGHDQKGNPRRDRQSENGGKEKGSSRKRAGNLAERDHGWKRART